MKSNKLTIGIETHLASLRVLFRLTAPYLSPLQQESVIEQFEATMKYGEQEPGDETAEVAR